MLIDQDRSVVCSVHFRALSSFHHMALVVMVPAFAPQESQVCREVLDPQDQQALRVHPVRKDPQDHVEIKATQGNKEVTDSQAPRDHKGRRVKRAHGEPKVT